MKTSEFTHDLAGFVSCDVPVWQVREWTARLSVLYSALEDLGHFRLAAQAHLINSEIFDEILRDASKEAKE